MAAPWTVVGQSFSDGVLLPLKNSISRPPSDGSPLATARRLSILQKIDCKTPPLFSRPRITAVKRRQPENVGRSTVQIRQRSTNLTVLQSAPAGGGPRTPGCGGRRSPRLRRRRSFCLSSPTAMPRSHARRGSTGRPGFIIPISRARRSHGSSPPNYNASWDGPWPPLPVQSPPHQSNMPRPGASANFLARVSPAAYT